MKAIRLLILSLLTMLTLNGQASESLIFVRTNGSKVAFSTEGLKITYDDYAHAIVTNDDTNATLNLTDMDYMYFGDEDTAITGDVNGDGEVTIADVNALIDIILSDTDSNTVADVNGDGETGLADINAVIDIILSH